MTSRTRASSTVPVKPFAVPLLELRLEHAHHVGGALILLLDRARERVAQLLLECHEHLRDPSYYSATSRRERVPHPVEALLQQGSGAAEVEAHEARAATAERRAVAQRDARALEEEGERVAARNRGAPAVEPGEVGPFGRRHDDARQVLPRVVHDEVPVHLEIAEERREPWLAVAVGGQRRRVAQDVHAVDEIRARRGEAFAQRGVRNHGEPELETLQVPGLARRHERDRPPGDLGRERRDWAVTVAFEDEVAVALVGDDL